MEPACGSSMRESTVRSWLDKMIQPAGIWLMEYYEIV